MIKTVKHSLNCAISAGESPWTALLHLRTTPLTSKIPSPAVLMGRNLRNLLPNAKLEQSNVDEEVRENLVDRQNIMKSKHDRLNHARDLEPLKEGQDVLVQKAPNEQVWTHGTIVKILDENHHNRSYQVRITGSGSLVIRNRRLLKPTTLSAERFRVKVQTGPPIRLVAPTQCEGSSKQEAAPTAQPNLHNLRSQSNPVPKSLATAQPVQKTKQSSRRSVSAAAKPDAHTGTPRKMTLRSAMAKTVADTVPAKMVLRSSTKPVGSIRFRTY